MHGMIKRLTWLTLMALATGAFWGQEVLSHPGGGAATGEEFELRGKITAVRLGKPHGEVTLDVEGKTWIVEIGQPRHNERAGLSKELLSAGQIITVHGYRFAKVEKLLMKAKRVMINGKNYDLYPQAGPRPSPKWRTFWVSPFWPKR